tara:strand:- start:4955 stop:5836 length:882 start_codon:yes stop_codon:yes gene_type:complete
MSFATRRERILQQGKQRQMLTSDRVPLGTEGSDGDIRITKTNEGTRLLVKSGSEWLGTPPLITLTNKANTNEIEHSFITKLKDKNNDEALTIDSSMTIHKPLILNSTLNVGTGGADINGTCEANAYTIAGTTLAEYISDTVGGMVTSNTETDITVTYQDGDNTLDFEVGSSSITSEGVVESCKIKIFQGTSASVDNAERITHGITNGRKRIAMISTSIETEHGISPSIGGSNNPPAGSFLTGGGSVQDEIDVDRQFQTYYDDTYIYIVTDSDADDVDNNQYVCTVWYTGTDIY